LPHQNPPAEPGQRIIRGGGNTVPTPGPRGVKHRIREGGWFRENRIPFYPESDTKEQISGRSVDEERKSKKKTPGAPREDREIPEGEESQKQEKLRSNIFFNKRRI